MSYEVWLFIGNKVTKIEKKHIANLLIFFNNYLYIFKISANQPISTYWIYKYILNIYNKVQYTFTQGINKTELTWIIIIEQ